MLWKKYVILFYPIVFNILIVDVSYQNIIDKNIKNRPQKAWAGRGRLTFYVSVNGLQWVRLFYAHTDDTVGDWLSYSFGHPSNLANRCLGTSRFNQRTRSIHMRLTSPLGGSVPADASSMVITGMLRSTPA
ncbi:MAG: hypothetical protein ACI9D5_000105 [Candidatus Endobugula sp.]